MYERDFMIWTMETRCTFSLKILYLLKVNCKFIVSVCKCLPPVSPIQLMITLIVENLLYSQHIDKIIIFFYPFKGYQYFDYNIKICTEFQLKCATCFHSINYQYTPSFNILYPNTTFWTGNFFNFGSKRL